MFILIFDNNRLKDSILRLENYIRKNKYKGYDIYDGLRSPIFKYNLFNKRKFRFYFQQIVKRIPINVRPIFFITKGYNPVTIGLCLQASSYLLEVFKDRKENILTNLDFLLNELIRLQSRDYNGSCWGYDFDWESRYSTIPAFTPTIVATGIITNALFEYYKITNDERAFKLCKSAANFVLKDLNRIYFDDTFCFSYSPLDKQIVFNATMKGARLLAQVYSITKENILKETARKTVEFVMKNQDKNGAWIYSYGDKRKWVDNYHTGYILDALQSYMYYTKDYMYKNKLELGVNYYINNFFVNNTLPKFYDIKIYPIDSTAIAQSIITLLKFGYIDLAKNVGNWVINNFQDSDGHIYFRKYKYYTSKVSFMRWSNAWMFLALSNLLYVINKN